MTMIKHTYSHTGDYALWENGEQCTKVIYNKQFTQVPRKDKLGVSSNQKFSHKELFPNS